VILGDGSLAAWIAGEIGRLGLSATVALEGAVPRDDVLRWVGRSRAFLFPSRWVENCPLSLAEAVSGNLVPVLSGGCDGGRELLDRVRAPYVVSALEPDALARACLEAVASYRDDPSVGLRVAGIHDAARAGKASDAIVMGKVN
jgi:glycosyltransferase involved in cell wall biosynthesis